MNLLINTLPVLVQEAARDAFKDPSLYVRYQRQLPHGQAEMYSFFVQIKLSDVDWKSDQKMNAKEVCFLRRSDLDYCVCVRTQFQQQMEAIPSVKRYGEGSSECVKFVYTDSKRVGVDDVQSLICETQDTETNRDVGRLFSTGIKRDHTWQTKTFDPMDLEDLKNATTGEWAGIFDKNNIEYVKEFLIEPTFVTREICTIQFYGGRKILHGKK